MKDIFFICVSKKDYDGVWKGSINDFMLFLTGKKKQNKLRGYRSQAERNQVSLLLLIKLLESLDYVWGPNGLASNFCLPLSNLDFKIACSKQNSGQGNCLPGLSQRGAEKRLIPPAYSFWLISSPQSSKGNHSPTRYPTPPWEDVRQG